MNPPLELSPVFQWFISGIGSLGIFLLNSMRSEQKKTNEKLSAHLEDRTLHTDCGKVHK